MLLFGGTMPWLRELENRRGRLNIGRK